MPSYIKIDEEKASYKNDTCFICLEDSSNGKLRRCCSQCFALVHSSCWIKWNNSQRITALRNILLGEDVRETSICTICRSGSAHIEALEGSDDEIGELNKLFNSGIIRNFFRIIINRAYGNSYSSTIITSENPFCNIKSLILNALFLSIIFFYIFYQDNNVNSKSLITVSLWAYITLVLQFLISTGVHRRQILNELSINEPSLIDDYETIDLNNTG